MADYDDDMNTPLTKEEQAFISRKANELSHLFDGPAQPPREWRYYDALGEGFSSLIHRFDTSNMENERLQSLVGLSDEQFADAVQSGRVNREEWPLGMMSRERRDALLQGRIAERQNYQDMINQTAGYFKPTPHAQPDGILENIAYHGLASIPNVLAGFGEFAALGPAGMLAANTLEGNKNATEQVYSNLRSQGQPIDIARQEAIGPFDQLADLGVRGATNLAVMNALGQNLNPQWTPGSMSPFAQTAANILTAGAVSGAGAEATQALTKYRSGIDNDIADLAKQGLIAGATTMGIGTLSALRHGRKLWEAQKQYRASTPIEAEAIEIYPESMPSGGEPTPPESSQPTPENPTPPTAPNGNTQPQARWGEVLNKYGLSPNSQPPDIVNAIKNGFISQQDATSMLSELGLSQQTIQNMINSANPNISSAITPQNRPEPTIISGGTTWQDPLSSKPNTGQNAPSITQITPQNMLDAIHQTTVSPVISNWYQNRQTGAQQPAIPEEAAVEEGLRGLNAIMPYIPNADNQELTLSPEDKANIIRYGNVPQEAVQLYTAMGRTPREHGFDVQTHDGLTNPNVTVDTVNLTPQVIPQINNGLTRPNVDTQNGLTTPQLTVNTVNLTPRVTPQINHGLTRPNVNVQGEPVFITQPNVTKTNQKDFPKIQAPDYGKPTELEDDDWEKDIISEIQVDHMGTPYNVNVLVGEPIDDFKHRGWGHPLEFVDDDGNTVAKFFPSLRQLEIAPEFEKVGWVRSFIYNLPEDLDRQMHYAGMLDRYADIKPEVFKEQDYGTKLAQILQQPNNHNDEEDDEDLDNYSGSNQSPEEAAKELADMFRSSRIINTKVLNELLTPQKTVQTAQPEQPKTPQVTPTPAPTKTTKRKKQPKQAAEPKITVFANGTTYKVYPEENGVSRVAQVLEGGGEMFDLYFKDGKLWHYTLGGGYNHELNEQEQNLERTILSKLNESAKSAPKVTPVPEEKKAPAPAQPEKSGSGSAYVYSPFSLIDPRASGEWQKVDTRAEKKSGPKVIGHVSPKNRPDTVIDVVFPHYRGNAEENKKDGPALLFKNGFDERLGMYLPYWDKFIWWSPGMKYYAPTDLEPVIEDKLPELLKTAGLLDDNGYLIPDGYKNKRDRGPWTPEDSKKKPTQEQTSEPKPETAQDKKNDHYAPQGHKLVGHINVMEAGKDTTFDVYRYDYGDGKYRLRTIPHGDNPNELVSKIYDFRYDPESDFITSGDNGSTAWNDKFKKALREKLPELLKAAGIPEPRKKQEQGKTKAKNSWEFTIDDKTFNVRLDDSSKYSGKIFLVSLGNSRVAEYRPYTDTYSDPLEKTGYALEISAAIWEHMPQWLNEAGLLDDNGNLIPDGNEKTRDETGDHATWTSRKNEARLRSAQKNVEKKRTEEEQRTKQREEAIRQRTAQTETKTKQPQQTATPDKAFNLAPYQQIAQEVKKLVSEGQPLTNRQLFDIAAKAFGGTIGEGKFSEKDAYDAMEMGVNLAILDMKYSPNQPNDSNIAGSFISDIDDLRDSILSKLPTQSNRTEDQNAFQQFSTPPHLAYLVNWLANIHEGDRVLEPSAGLGGLAVFAKNAGATLVLNELDTNRRNPLLKSMNLGETLHENAENIGDILIGRGYSKFDKIIMNPPFSSAGDRGIKDSIIGIQHLDSALQLLKPNGRLVIILGENMKDDHKAWKHIKEHFNVRANITINGRNYSKYGTSYGNSVIVIDNTGATPPNSTVTGSFDDIKKIADIEAITHVRDDVPVTDKTESEVTEKTQTTQAPEQKKNTVQPVQSTARPEQKNVEPVATSKPEQVAQEPKPAAAQRKKSTATATAPKPKEDNMSKRSIAKIKSESSPVKISRRTEAERSKKLSEARKYYEDLFGKQDDESLFEPYVPSKIKIENAKHHPADLVESAAMSAIKMPDITYSPVLPPEIIEKGGVSEEQLEAVTYAGQAHKKFLLTGERQGFLIGDGTGVGKGTEILAIIMDNFAQGHGNGKAVWLSVNTDLSEAAKSDWKRLGNNPDNIFTHSSKTEDIPSDREGILFMGYQTLITKRDPKGGDNTLVHIEQIKKWLGENFDGVIVLDECHKIRNAVAREGSRGIVKPAQSAMAAQELLRAFPSARVVYASATNSTDASHLCMFGRLGLWGEGTAFTNDAEFVLAIDRSGVSALEIVARTLKARGLFVSRSISLRAGPNGNNENVTFSILEHKLTQVQVKIYNTVASALRMTEQNIEKAVEACGGGVDKRTASSKKRGAAISQYWSFHQRICLQLITAFKTDTIIKDIQAALDRGESVLVNVTNTGDANFTRALNRNKENANNTLDDLDVSLIDPLIDMLEESFPIYSVESYKDEETNEIKYRNVVDSEGKPVVNQQALALLNQTIAQLNMVRGEIPAGLIDAITMHFGTDMVAECTARNNRLVITDDGKRTVIGGPKKLIETDAFNNGKKRILIFSEAGSTGVSYHASRDFKNQQKRRLLIAEPGWNPFTFVQSLGRVHRSNQVHKPEIVMVSTDLPGEIRIRSTVTRRMQQLGASSTGERKANSQGLLSENDNLESEEAKTAMHRLFSGIFKGFYPDLPAKDVLEQMGYKPKNFEKDFPQMTQILNRLMAMDVVYQNRFLKRFESLRDEEIAQAIKANRYNRGLSTVKARNVSVLNENIIKTDKETGIDTKYVQLELQRQRKRRTFNEAVEGQYDTFFMTSEGKIVAARKLGERDEEGNLVRPRIEYDYVKVNGEMELVPYQMYSIVSPDFNFSREISQRLLENKSDRQETTYTPVDKKDAKKIWDEQYEKLTGYGIETMHLITGDLLSLWHTLSGYTNNIERVVANDGREFLGIRIRDEHIQNVLTRFHIHYNGIGKDFKSLMQELDKQGQSLLLNNGLSVKYSRVNGEKLIEIYPKQFFTITILEDLKAKDFIVREINYKNRVFVPIGKEELLETYIKEHPVQEIKKRDPLAEATDEINSVIDASSRDNLHFVPPDVAATINPDENPYVHKSQYAFNEKSEKRYQESKHIKRPTLWHRVADAGRQIWRGFSDVPELSGDDELIPAQELVRELNRELRASTQETERRLRAALKDLNPDDYDLFGRAMALLDLKETIELDSKAALPWDYSPDSLNADYENIMKYVNQNPKVADAIEKAELLNKEITAALIKAADKLQLFDLRDRLKRQHYFRHIVLEYYHQSGGATPRPTMKNPQRRGYLKHREGSEKDIASDWILAMAEVWLRMNNDIKIIDTLVKIRKKYDIIEDLKQKAFNLNYQKALHKIIADLPNDKDFEDIEFTDAGMFNRAKEKLDKSLNHRQAQSVERLFKMAKNGDLPAGDNNEWVEFLGKFADAGQLENLDSKTREELPRYIGWLAGLEQPKEGLNETTRIYNIAKKFSQRTERLFKLAQEGNLPTGDNNEWLELLGKLADAGSMNALDKDTLKQFTKYVSWLSSIEQQDDEPKAITRRRNTAKKINTVIARLLQLAQKGELPAGNNNQWLTVLGKFTDANSLDNLDKDTLKQFLNYINWLNGIEQRREQSIATTKAHHIAQKFLRGHISKQKGLKDILGEKYIQWQKLIPDDYTLWSPSDSRIIFSANSVSENALLMAEENIDELLGLPISELGNIIASGGNKQFWCIPQKLADALNNIGKKQPQGMFANFLRESNNWFQGYILTTPTKGRVFMYNWRNFFGDLEAVLQGNPATLKYVPKSMRELTNYMLKLGEPTGMLAEFTKRGGAITTEFASELENWQELDRFAHLFEQEKTLNPAKLTLRFFKGYMALARKLTNFRESILRYAAFQAYYNQIINNEGNAPILGMSKAKEVNAVKDDIYDMAFKLANENLGAYDQVSQNVRWLRNNGLMSFISWIEVNAKRSIQLYKNIWTGNSYLEYYIRKYGPKIINSFTGGGGGDKKPPINNNSSTSGNFDGKNNGWDWTVRQLKKSPCFIMRFAITLAMAAPMMLLCGLFNYIRGYKSKDVPGQSLFNTLILGTNGYNGEILSMNRLSAALDFFEFTGVDNIPKDVKDLWDGKTTLGAVVSNIVSGPINRLISNVNPLIKSVIEMTTGRRLFPDFRDPSSIRSVPRYIAQSLALDWYYDWLTGKAHKPFTDFASSLFNSHNILAASYWYILSKKEEFESMKLGRHYDGFYQTEKSEALREAKRAAEMGDRQTMRKFLGEYKQAKGTTEGLKQSIRTMHPLFGLSEREIRQFRRWLSPDDNEILAKAMKYYRQTSRTLNRR